MNTPTELTQTGQDAETYLTPAEVSALTRGTVSIDRLRRLRFEGGGPIFMKPTPRTVLYSAADVHAWLASTSMARTDLRAA